MDYGNTKIPSMQGRLGSMTLSQLAFPREGNPNFPWEKSHWDNTVVKRLLLFLKYSYMHGTPASQHSSCKTWSKKRSPNKTHPPICLMQVTGVPPNNYHTASINSRQFQLAMQQARQSSSDISIESSSSNTQQRQQQQRLMEQQSRAMLEASKVSGALC